jgi:hypothetical protein
MSVSESSLETMVRDLETVTGEIGRLRDAVANHRDAALGLDAIATSLGNLARQLPNLPREVQNQFSGVSQLVLSLEAALRPAGSLEASINSLVANNEQVLRQLLSDREVLRSELQAFKEEAVSLRALMRELHAETRSDLATVLTSVQERAASSDLAALAATTQELSHRHMDHSAAQERDAEAIRTRLAKLTGLARRGFFAILRGKDAPPEPL